MAPVRPGEGSRWGRWMCLKGSVTLWRGAHTEAGLLEQLVTLRGTRAGAVRSSGRNHAGEVSEGLSPIGETPCCSRVRRKEQKRQCIINGCQSPLPIPLRCLAGEVRVKLSL